MKRINYEKLNKLYYSIGEVAEMFDVNTSLIRFWEKEFTVLKPKKNTKGNRQFTPKDIAAIEKIYVLVKEKGFTLEGAKKAMKKSSGIDPLEQETPSVDPVINRLEQIREKLIRLKK